MNFILNYAKGVLVGVGGIAPGLSGSVMLLLLGLYEKTINAIGAIFKNLKQNLLFLVPLVLGLATGALLFSKAVDYLIVSYEFQTRFLFFGLVVGTVPFFFQSVKKNGFGARYWVMIAAAAAVGFVLFFLNNDLFPPVSDPSYLQSFFLGIAYAGSSIIPGVDSAVILSSLGLYDAFLSAMSDIDLPVLIPAGIGLVIGAVTISALMSALIKRFYTATFSIVLGLFISMIPSVLNDRTGTSLIMKMDSAPEWLLALLLVLVGFAASFYFGDVQANNQRLKRLFAKKK